MNSKQKYYFMMQGNSGTPFILPPLTTLSSWDGYGSGSWCSIPDAYLLAGVSVNLGGTKLIKKVSFYVSKVTSGTITLRVKLLEGFTYYDGIYGDGYVPSSNANVVATSENVILNGASEGNVSFPFGTLYESTERLGIVVEVVDGSGSVGLKCQSGGSATPAVYRADTLDWIHINTYLPWYKIEGYAIN